MRYQFLLGLSVLFLITGCGQGTSPRNANTPLPLPQQNVNTISSATNASTPNKASTETDIKDIQALSQKLQDASRQGDSFDMDTALSDEN